MGKIAAKWYSTATAWMLGTTSLVSVLAPGQAQAVVATCSDPYTGAGGESVAAPTVIPSDCSFASITGDQDFPGYWEFAWNGSGNGVISASVMGGTPGEYGPYAGGSFFGDLALYDASGNLIQAADFTTATYADTYTGETDASLGDVLDGLPAAEYIVGIEPAVTSSETDLPFAITFSPASVPEPASLGLFGGALAALGWFRKRRQGSR